MASRHFFFSFNYDDNKAVFTWKRFLVHITNSKPLARSLTPCAIKYKIAAAR